MSDVSRSTVFERIRLGLEQAVAHAEGRSHGVTMNHHIITGGVAGLRGSEPIGAALTIGRKPEQGAGFPIEKDRFHLVLPYDVDGRRPVHPSFGSFNAAPVDRRRTIRGVIAHASWSDCLDQRLQAYRLPHPWRPHPGKLPACTGNAVVASRYHGERGPDDFRQMPCPGEKCPYRQPGTKDGKPQPPPCKYFTRFLFRIDWTGTGYATSGAPTPLVKFTSGGIYTYRAILGLKESLDAAAAAIGVETYSPFGARFTLTLMERSNPEAKTRFPVIVASMDESAPDFLLASSRRLLETRTALLSLPTLHDPDQVAALASDSRIILEGA